MPHLLPRRCAEKSACPFNWPHADGCLPQGRSRVSPRAYAPFSSELEAEDLPVDRRPQQDRCGEREHRQHDPLAHRQPTSHPDKRGGRNQPEATHGRHSEEGDGEDRHRGHAELNRTADPDEEGDSSGGIPPETPPGSSSSEVCRHRSELDGVVAGRWPVCRRRRSRHRQPSPIRG